MNKDDLRDQEDKGIPVGNLLDGDIISILKNRLKELRHSEIGEIDLTPWTTTSNGMAVDESILALIIKNTGQKGVVRVLSKPARVTKSEGLLEEVLIVFPPGETALIVGSLSVRYVRRRKAH